MEKKEIKGKIYTIRSPHTDKYYIGSTIQKYLCKRMAHHRLGKDGCTSKQIIDAGDAYIELLELYNCNSKEELRKREGELIREHKDNCINKSIAGLSLKESYSQHYQNNKEEILKKRSEIINCECGSIYIKNNKSIHIKTNKHLNFINQIVI
jgi:hypothetical protein